MEASAKRPSDELATTRLIADWPAQVRIAAVQMMAKYGQPQESSTEKLVWHDEGPYLRIEVSKQLDHHDFPRPHMDFLEHTIAYRVPHEQASALTAFDGSATFDRTKGELSARCDLEGHNILTLNLAHDLVTGKKSVEEARKAFGDIVVEDTLGENPPYVMALQFEVERRPAQDPDSPVIAGSPTRPGTGNDSGGSRSQPVPMNSMLDDATILGLIVAIDDNEIAAAMDASTKKVRQDVLAYARMLHKEHGQNLKDTLELGVAQGIVPAENATVTAKRLEGANELVKLAPMMGDEFAQAYVAAMVKGHEGVLALIDGKLLPAAKDEEVKRHLTETRGHIAMHLDQARGLQGGPKSNSKL